jgi:hypothetical protein
MPGYLAGVPDECLPVLRKELAAGRDAAHVLLVMAARDAVRSGEHGLITSRARFHKELAMLENDVHLEIAARKGRHD